jgi:hypothetical protein
MSDDNALAEKPTTDIVGKDQDKLQEYMEAGTPGIGDIEQPEIEKMFDLYLHGRTYNSISGVMHVPKVKILFLSHRLNWFETRQQYFNELQANINTRLMEAKIQGQDFFINMQQMIQKKIGQKMNRYISTGNEEYADQINLKELDRLIKIQELLQKGSSPSEGRPLVGINVGEGATITKTGANEIEVTPKDSAKKNMLKYYADLNREKTKK